MKISFVIPVYNESESLEQLYSEIIHEVSAVYDYEIIFIDDGSVDDSFTILERIASKDSNVRVVQFRRNFGKAAALQTGFEIASGEYVLTLDSDLQDNPKEIHSFISKLEEGYDLVSGWKKRRKDPISKTLPSRFFNKVTSTLFKLPLKDFNCGFKAYRNEVVKELDIYGELHRYIPVLAHSKGFKVAEIPVDHRERTFGKSKYGFERLFRGFFDLLTVSLLTSYIRSPLYLFGSIGFYTSAAGFVIGLYLSIMKIFYGMPLSNRPLLFMSILLITVGLQFFSIGLIGELIINQNRKHTKSSAVSIRKRLNV
ncbi:MAG: glycosyltransferase [Candidatus Cloacimonas sp.]|nr:glycosyltransferase [Candidatus Cloacimonadota bacterium]